VIGMTVSKHDSFDLAARLCGGCDQAVGRPAERRVNEGEAIVVADEIGINRLETGELKQVIIKLDGPHRPDSDTGFLLGILRFFWCRVRLVKRSPAITVPSRVSRKAT
jgi:hypothetical protein